MDLCRVISRSTYVRRVYCVLVSAIHFAAKNTTKSRKKNRPILSASRTATQLEVRAKRRRDKKKL